MRRETPFEIDKLDYFSARHFFEEENCDNPKIERMKKILYIGLETELTQRQYDCIQYRYLDKKSVKEIADLLNIKPTTVYKHIKKALKTLRKCGKYL